MIRLGRFRLALEAVLVFAVLVGVGTCIVTEREPDPRAAQLAANTYKATLLGLQRRRTADSLSGVVHTLQHDAKRRTTTIRRMSREAEAMLAANDTLLSYAGGASVPSDSTIAALSHRLAETTASYRTFLDSTNVLLDRVDTLIAAQLREREGFHAERLAAAAERQAIAAERDHYKAKAACKVGPFPCPSRKQVAALGLLWLLV